MSPDAKIQICINYFKKKKLEVTGGWVGIGEEEEKEGKKMTFLTFLLK